MVIVLSLSFLLAATLFLLLIYQPGEDRMVLSRTIDRPISSVFKVVEDLRRTPVWRRQPLWLPASWRSLRMSRWGEHISAAQRESGNCRKATPDIRIRCIGNREFAYRSVCSSDLSYESSFHLMPDNGKCLLVWEIRYQLHRLPDILSRSAIAAAVQASMVNSMQYIERVAVCSQSPSRARSGMYAASRDQAPAA